MSRERRPLRIREIYPSLQGKDLVICAAVLNTMRAHLCMGTGPRWADARRAPKDG